MTYLVVWSLDAIRAVRRVRETNPDDAKLIRDKVRALSLNPRPRGSGPLGGSSLHRLQLGDYRVTYEIRDAAAVITVIMIVRVGAG